MMSNNPTNGGQSLKGKTTMSPSKRKSQGLYSTPPTSPLHLPRPPAPSEKEVQANSSIQMVETHDEDKHVSERKPLGPEPTYRWFDPLLSLVFGIVYYSYGFLLVRFTTFFVTLLVFVPWYFFYHLTELPARIAAMLEFTTGLHTRASKEKQADNQEFVPGTFARTPEKCFDGIPDYNFEPNYFNFKGLRVHYVDVGPKEGALHTLVFLHGNPSWSYLFRQVLWQLSSSYRVLAVDMVGFGKSDKLIFEPHTVKIQVEMFVNFINHLNLRDLTLVLHDWGGPIGLSALDEIKADGFLKNLILMDTFILGHAHLRHEMDLSSSLMLANFQMYGAMFGRHSFLNPIIRFLAPNAPTSVVRGYTAPHPDSSTSNVLETFPRFLHPYLPLHLMPFFTTLFPELTENMKSDEDIYQRNMSIRKRLKTFNRPVLIIYGKHDHVTAHFRSKWRGLFPEDCLKKTGGRIVVVVNAGHFVAEDDPDTICDVIRNWLEERAIEYTDKVHFM